LNDNNIDKGKQQAVVGFLPFPAFPIILMSIGDEGAGSLQKPHHFKITSPFSVKAICSAEILPLNSSKSGRRT